MTDTLDAFPYPLASTAWLAERLSADDIRIVDASWRMPGAGRAIDDHGQRRIPGAVFFDLDEIADHTTDLPHMLPAPDVFAAAVGALGITADDRVIIYDDAGIFSAARVWWTFRAMGHERVSVLDGGLPKWMKEGRPLDTGLAAPAPKTYAVQPARTLARTAQDVRRMLGDKSGVVIDARPAPRFKGEAKEPRPHLRSGRMPGAVNLPHTLLLRETGEMASAEDLARRFKDLSVSPDAPVIASCGSGVTAAVICLALERIGHPAYGLYDGSWTEWGADTNDPALFPVTKG